MDSELSSNSFFVEKDNFFKILLCQISLVTSLSKHSIIFYITISQMGVHRHQRINDCTPMNLMNFQEKLKLLDFHFDKI